MLHKDSPPEVGKQDAPKPLDENKIPPIVRYLCWQLDGWVVGSAVYYLLGAEEKYPDDFDVVINHKNWNEACKTCLLGKWVTVNSFGGLKISTDDVLETKIDVWMDDVAELMGNHHVEVAYHPKTKTVLRRSKV